MSPMTEALWRELNIEEKITQILQEIPDSAPEHHLGRAFLTAYQLAIEYKRRHPEDVDRLGLLVGGAGVGQRTSLAQYLALELSRRIRSNELTRIEGGFLSNQHLHDINFDAEGEIIHSSLTETLPCYAHPSLIQTKVLTQHRYGVGNSQCISSSRVAR